MKQEKASQEKTLRNTRHYHPDLELKGNQSSIKKIAQSKTPGLV
jgi:hypothetical protein